jgi:alkanesulfonate monooxygenase SsuD/methylene tetrahydromethanopterin reductase-like flavin-dependent oxidoreductase (luciferase family)
VHLGGHHRDFAETLALVRCAEAAGYRAAYVDGDVTIVPSRGDAPVLDGWTATVAYLARTERIEIGSIRLVHHWNVARLAQAVATLESVVPGRLRLLASIGAQPTDRRFGLEFLPTPERVAWLDEWLGALRRLLAGEVVTLRGHHVALDAALVRPIPRGGRMPIEVGGARRAVLDVVARRADRWDMNVAPVERRVRAATAELVAACRAAGRDPDSVGRSMFVFVRPGADPSSASTRDSYRRWQPWFRDLPDAELAEAIVAGPVGSCRDRIAALRTALGVDLPVLDLAGLDRSAAASAIESLAGS